LRWMPVEAAMLSTQTYSTTFKPLIQIVSASPTNDIHIRIRFCCNLLK
jgi:hypothetical protein